MDDFKNLSNDKKEMLKTVIYHFKDLPDCLQDLILNDEQLEDQYINELLGDELSGSGLFDGIRGFFKDAIRNVKRFFSPRLDGFNNISKKTLDQYGTMPVVRVQIYRTPLSNALNLVLQGLSFGQWEQLKQKYGFDKFYHLALILTVKTPQGFEKNIVTEKVQEVEVREDYKTTKYTEALQIPISNMPFTIQQMVDQTMQRMGKQQFFAYEAFNNNCQVYVAENLKSVNMYTPQAQQFLFQDLSGIAQEINPMLRNVMKGVTDVGNIVSKWSGRGKDIEDIIDECCCENKEGGMKRVTIAPPTTRDKEDDEEDTFEIISKTSGLHKVPAKLYQPKPHHLIDPSYRADADTFSLSTSEDEPKEASAAALASASTSEDEPVPAPAHRRRGRSHAVFEEPVEASAAASASASSAAPHRRKARSRVIFGTPPEREPEREIPRGFNPKTPAFEGPPDMGRGKQSKYLVEFPKSHYNLREARKEFNQLDLEDGKVKKTKDKILFYNEMPDKKNKTKLNKNVIFYYE